MTTALERWAWLTAEVNGRTAIGMPGVRDPESPCELFTPGEPSSTSGCDSDGHYICEECLHLKVCPDCGVRSVQCECVDDVVTSRVSRSTTES